MSVGGKRIYSKAFVEIKEVVLWDVFPVTNGDTVLLTFESKNSDWSQGVWLMCNEGVEINGSIGKNAMLWYETAPKQIKVNVSTG